MSRYAFELKTADDRAQLVRVIHHAPTGTRVEIKGPARSRKQNNMMWAILTQISVQLDYPRLGRKVSPDTWKTSLLRAYGVETEMIYSLDGSELLTVPSQTSALSKEQFSDFIEWLLAFAAEHNVQIEPKREAAACPPTRTAAGK